MMDPEHFTHGRGMFPTRSVVAVPLLRGESAIGALSLTRPTQGAFSTAQMDLLQTFAEQAVIAITSAETYRALRTRTSDLQETLEYQTATSDVLKVISRSSFDLQPVLDTLAREYDRPNSFTFAQQRHPQRGPHLAQGNRPGRVVWLGRNVMNMHNAALKRGHVANDMSVERHCP